MVREVYVADEVDTAVAAPVGTLLHSQPFQEQLRGYFRKYRGSSLESVAVRQLEGELNAALKTLQAPDGDAIDAEGMEKLLAGKIGPKPSHIKALAMVFTNARIGFFADEREAFTEAGMREADIEIKRDHALQAQREELRLTNPGRDASKPSFVEMLEETYRKGGSFKEFLFDRVLPAWGIDKQQFCDHLGVLNKEREGKKTFSAYALDTWADDIYTPLRDSMRVICDAFAIKPAEGQAIAPHEAMLWRLAGGKPFEWKNLKGAPALKKAIEDCRASGDHGPLVSELCAASGIPYNHMKERLGTEQLAQWKNGKGHIEDMAQAVSFIAMVNPCLGREDQDRQAFNRDIFALVTGRANDLDAVIKEAGTKGNPAGALFSALTGRGGMVTISSDDITAGMRKAGLTAFAKSAVSRMRNPVNRPRGSDLSEIHADAVMDMFEEKIKPLVALGIYKEVTPAQREQCIEMLTRCPHPSKLLKECIEGKINIREMVRRSYERKGLHQQGEGGFGEQSGIHNVSAFLTHPDRHLTPEVAERLAQWFANSYEFTQKEQRQVMALAQGIDLRKSPEQVFDEARAGTLGRPEALRTLYDMTGLTRAALAEAAGVPASLIQYSVAEASGGRIASKELDGAALARHVRAIAGEVGLGSRAGEFAEQFSTVARQVALMQRQAEGRNGSATGTDGATGRA